MKNPTELSAAIKGHVMVIVEEIIGKAVAVVHKAAAVSTGQSTHVVKELLIDFVGVAFEVRCGDRYPHQNGRDTMGLEVRQHGFQMSGVEPLNPEAAEPFLNTRASGLYPTVGGFSLRLGAILGMHPGRIGCFRFGCHGSRLLLGTVRERLVLLVRVDLGLNLGRRGCVDFFSRVASKLLLSAGRKRQVRW